DRDIKELFKSDEQKERFIDWLYGLIRNPETGNRLLVRAGDWLEEKGSDAAQVGDYIPIESREWLAGVTDVLYEPFFGFVLDWLQSGSMRMQLQNRGRELLRNILEKLNTFQRFLVAATQYDKTLDEKMPEIVDDVIKSMKEAVADEETRKTMLDTVVASIDELRARTIGEVNESYGLPGKVKTVFQALQRTISEDPAGDSLKTVLRNILTQLENRSLESFLEHAFTVSDAADYLTDLVSSSVESSADAISRSAMEQISDIIDRKGNAKIGELLGISNSGKAKIDSRLAQIALDALAKQIPGILDTLDVHEMVVSKINGLAVEDVEGLLLRVIHRHLKWINVFGAILGFFIGMMQVVTRLF
ncbi:MAG: DUF445 family protein, partial [Spirochaetales bacterium]|nr:DUF445 family protein [Spirochaetales bacterium]